MPCPNRQKLIYESDGLARLPADDHGRGKAVFIPFVLPAEQSKPPSPNKNPASPVRNSNPYPIARSHHPHCSYFRSLRQMSLQHTTYDHQLQFKAEILEGSQTHRQAGTHHPISRLYLPHEKTATARAFKFAQN